MGVVREENGVAGEILRSAGFDLASLREQLANLENSQTSQAGPKAHSVPRSIDTEN